MEVLKTFGIDWFIVAAQIVNFLIILYVLKRFLYKPIFNMIQKRADIVKESLKHADESNKAYEHAQKEEKKIIAKAQDTARQIISDAREQSATMLKDAEESTKKQTQRMIDEAKRQIEQETQAAEKQLSKHISQLSIDILKKSMQNVFTDDEQSELVEKALKDIGKKPN